MKKALSILMAILVLSMSFVVSVSAADPVCTCEDHKAGTDKSCYCCIYCDNLDRDQLTSCGKDADGTEVLCCNECSGIYPCTCGCPCCTLTDAEIEDSKNDPILNEEQQQEVIDTFQRVLRQISDFFDKLFDAIFEFLRFDEIMG